MGTLVNSSIAEIDQLNGTSDSLDTSTECLAATERTQPLTRQPHPASELFPAMTEGEFQKLKEDVAKHGQRDAITLHDGKILDGRAMYRACLELALQPTTVEWQVDGDPTDFVVSRNLHRRHLTRNQRAMIGARLAVLRKEQAQATRETQDSSRAGLPAKTKSKRRTGRQRDEIAKAMATSPRSIEQATVIQRQGTAEVVAAVESGQITLTAGERLARQGEACQLQAVADLNAPKPGKKTKKREPDDRGCVHLDAAETPSEFDARDFAQQVIAYLGNVRAAAVRDEMSFLLDKSEAASDAFEAASSRSI